MTSNRLGTRGIPRLRTLLTERDEQILRSLYDHKFLSTRQIQRLHFWNHSSYGSAIRACTRVLARLQGHGFIYKLDRPIGGSGGGSTSYVWGVDAAGDRFMRSVVEMDAKRARAFEPALLFLEHTLAVAEARVVIEEVARTGAIQLLGVTTEPGNWRSFIAEGGGAMTLKPDLYVLTASADFEDHWFIEIDRGTESLPTLIRKCEYYQRYHRTGQAQAENGVFPLVLWVVPPGTRRDRLREAIVQSSRIDPEIFRVVNPDDLVSSITDPSTIPSTSVPVTRKEVHP